MASWCSLLEQWGREWFLLGEIQLTPNPSFPFIVGAGRMKDIEGNTFQRY